MWGWGVLVACVCVVLAAAYSYFQYKFLYWSKRGVEVVPPTFPFGNLRDTILVRKNFNEGILDWYRQVKGRFAGIYMLTTPGIIIKDPELIKHVLVKDFNCFIDRGIYTDESKEPMTGHLFRMTGQRWRNMRNKLSPSFTVGKLRMMFPTIVEVAQNMQESLSDAATKNKCIEIEDISMPYATDIIGSVIFGLECNSFKDRESNEFLSMAIDLFDYRTPTRIFKSVLNVCVPQLFKLLNMSSIQEKQSQFIYDVVRRVMRHREEKKIVRNDLMQLLIQLRNKGRVEESDEVVFDSVKNGNGLSMEEVAAQAYTFFFAGFETSATTINFLLYECALNPSVQKKVQDDIDAAVEKHGGITYESISEMDYLNKAVLETLRKYPILGFLIRVATKAYKIPGADVEIEEGTKVFISADGVQHDPEHYPFPQVFDPDRFSNENLLKRHPFCFLSFGEGPRSCIARNMGKVMVHVGIAMILQKYTVSICEETEMELKYSRFSYLTKTTKPIVLRISNRH